MSNGSFVLLTFFQIVFYRLAEANADAIMDAKPQAKKSEKSASSRKGEEMEDQVTKSEYYSV